jgi:hypothetical protein
VKALIFFVFAEGLFMPVFYQVKFTAHDGLYVIFIGFGYKLKRPEHISVVGQGYGGHVVGLGLFHHAGNFGRSVEQGKLGMAV